MASADAGLHGYHLKAVLQLLCPVQILHCSPLIQIISLEKRNFMAFAADIGSAQHGLLPFVIFSFVRDGLIIPFSCTNIHQKNILVGIKYDILLSGLPCYNSNHKYTGRSRLMVCRTDGCV